MGWQTLKLDYNRNYSSNEILCQYAYHHSQYFTSAIGCISQSWAWARFSHQPAAYSYYVASRCDSRLFG